MPTSAISLKLAARIKQIRIKKKLTLEEAAERCGFDLRYYQRIESKKPWSLRVDTLERVAKGLGVPIKKLFEF